MALASVGCCVRLQLPLVSISSSCSAEAGYGKGPQGGAVSYHQGLSPGRKAALQNLSHSATITAATTATTIPNHLHSTQETPKLHLRIPSRTNEVVATPEAQRIPGGKKVPAPQHPYQGPHGW